jgi:NTE family protein
MATKALVLGGGGVAGVAWELGVLAGLADAGVDVTDADLTVGTSAGSVVGSQLMGGVPLEALYQGQLSPSKEIAAAFDLGRLAAAFASARSSAGSAQEAQARLGAFALETETISEVERRAVIASRLPSHTWPERRVVLVAVDAATGEPRYFDRSDGVGLVDAVAASCAVPGVWPPVTIEGRRYTDGGVRSMTNVDVARGHDVVLVLAPLAEVPGAWTAPLPKQLADLHPSRTYLIGADEASLAAFGTNPLDPSTRAPAARAGRAQGRAAGPAVRALWSA